MKILLLSVGCHYVTEEAIKTVEQAQRIFNLGVEKIAISSSAVENPAIVTDIAKRVGNQSVVVVMDVLKRTMTGKYEIWTYNGTKKYWFESGRSLQ